MRADYSIKERVSAFTLLTYQRNPFAGVASRYNDADDQRINSETAFTAPISRQIALKAAYVVRFDNQPEPGFEDTDRILTTGVQIVFD